MDILEIIKQDYQTFPDDQTYSVYAEDVYFRDPLNEFRGVDRYRKNIEFIATWFKNIRLDLKDIRREGDTIITEWQLNWTSPLPWQPRISIPGWSELQLNPEGLIVSHIDYWHCSRWAVLQQHLFPKGENSLK